MSESKEARESQEWPAPRENLPVVAEAQRVALPSTDPHAEMLGRRMAQVYEERVLEFMRSLKVHPEEIGKIARRFNNSYTPQELEALPPDRVSWAALESVQEVDPALCGRKWNEILTDAEQRLQLGLLGAAATGDASPSQRAEYLAIRDELSTDWKPRNGIERTLLDQMAQAYVQFLRWQATMLYWMASDEWQAPRNADPTLPRMTTAQAVEQAGHMADRFNRIFLRTLRALVNMRRVPIIVQNAGQINVAQQQVNVSKPSESESQC